MGKKIWKQILRNIPQKQKMDKKLEHKILNEILRNEHYSLLAVMSELSTVRCDRVLGLWLQVHGSRVSMESCRGGAVADGPCGGRR